MAEGDRAGLVKLLRVTVTVSWTATDCPSDTCRYVTSTLVTPTQDDPTFG